MANDEMTVLTDEQLDELSDLMTDVACATALRPEDQQGEYEQAQESVVEARRAAEAHAGSLRITQ